MRYTGTVTPAARKAATPQAVACRLPCLLAWANTPAETAAVIATTAKKAGGSSDTTRGTVRDPRSNTSGAEDAVCGTRGVGTTAHAPRCSSSAALEPVVEV